MTTSKRKKVARTVALRRAFAALAAVSAALFVCGCDRASGTRSSANGGPPGASPPATRATAIAPRAGDGAQVAMAAPAVTDGDVARDQNVGGSGGMIHLAQAGNQQPAGRQRTRSPAAAVNQRRPLVVIRFDRPDVPYEPALYTAVSRALESRPSAIFDLVAVSPSTGSEAAAANRADEAQRDAERVMRTLSEMGLPADRVTLSAMFSNEIRDNEVRIFVR